MIADVIIVAAGSSRRAGFDKLEAKIGGRSVLERTVEAFENCKDIKNIIIVTSKEKREERDAWRATHHFRKLIGAIEGGPERYLSVAIGIEKLPKSDRLIAVHDGARPLITPKAISDCVQGALKYKAVSLAHPVSDTLKRSSEELEVLESVDRENLWGMETPQVFERALLENAYRYVLNEGIEVTDEVSAVEAIGEKVYLIKSSQPNLKITYPEDVQLAEVILELRKRRN